MASKQSWIFGVVCGCIAECTRTDMVGTISAVASMSDDGDVCDGVVLDTVADESSDRSVVSVLVDNWGFVGFGS